MSKKSQIVYFLGAGASAQSIPVIEGLRPRLLDLSFFLKNYLNTNLNESAFEILPEKLKNNQDVLLHLYDEIIWLYEVSEFHQTIDTLAKKFYIQESDDLLRLKRALIVYFYFEQAILFPSNRDLSRPNKSGVDDSILDKRYDNLIASIAYRETGNIKIKSHIKIVTWNYDIQIELAIKNYIEENLNTIKIKNNIHPNTSSYNSDSGVLDLDGFAVYKLNGNAFLDPGLDIDKINADTPHDSTNFHKEKPILIGEFLEQYQSLFPDNAMKNISAFKYFNFAWEADNSYVPKFIGHKLVIKNARNVLKNARVLIIIGYSFPYFNAEIDKEIFADCWPEQIIFQDFEPEKIKNRLFEMVPKFKGPISRDNPKIELIFMEPDKYFPIHPLT
jgi:hypothetical protein